jgi:hypothetical protein
MQSTGKCLKSNKVFTTQCLALKIKDRTKDSQSKFQLLEYQTSLLNSSFAYILEKMDFDWGAKIVVCGGHHGGWGALPPPPQLYS